MTGLRDLHRELTTRYQVVHAGVVRVPEAPATYLPGGIDDERRRQLCEIPLFEPDRLTDDGVVRYTLVARSSSGAENVSYEGIRCRAGTYRVYALGSKSGAPWSQRGASEWRPIEQKTLHRQHHALWREYFCPHRVPIVDAAEGADALARGGHPDRGGAGGLE